MQQQNIDQQPINLNSGKQQQQHLRSIIYQFKIDPN